MGEEGAAGGISPYSSGGGGVTLEQSYAATLLSSLLVGGSAIELGDGSKIKRIRFQAREESPVDDLVVSGYVRGQERRVAIGIRRKISLIKSHDKTKTLLAAYIRMTAEQQEEIKAGRLRLCLAVAVEDQHVQELRLLVKAAGTASGEAAFRGRVNGGGPGSALRRRLEHVDAMVASAAESAGPAALALTPVS